MAFIIITGLFGLCIGSFLNVVIWRLPRQEKLSGRSHCAKCGKTLSALELLPLLSFLVLRGRCRHCGQRISRRYPIIELVTGLLFALAAYYFPVRTNTEWIFLVRQLIIIALLIAVFVIDLEHYLILDKIVWPGIVAMLIFNLMTRQLFFSGLWGAAVLGGFFFLLWFLSRGKWLGAGDVKLALFIGLAIGWPTVIVVWFLSYFIGFLVALPLLLLRKKQLSSAIPFGTFLAVATVASLFIGPQLAQWYLRLVGFA